MVTIVTASFNALDGLRETIASVAGQTFTSLEHVIVDGGSTDGTQEYLESLGHTVRWISEPDDGIADAMNKGVGMARGEYALILHAEDYFMDQDSLGQAPEHLAKGKDIVSYNVLTISEGDRRIYKGQGFSFKAEFFATVPHQGAFCRRDLFDRIGGFDSRYHVAMDYGFMLKAKRCGLVFSVLTKRFLSCLQLALAQGWTGHRSERAWLKTGWCRTARERLFSPR